MNSEIRAARPTLFRTLCSGIRTSDMIYVNREQTPKKTSRLSQGWIDMAFQNQPPTLHTSSQRIR
jgi:hypothetical protein